MNPVAIALLILSLILSTIPAGSENLSEETEGAPVSFDYLIDAGGELDLNSVLDLPPARWTTARDAAVNLGYTDVALWARIKLHNASEYGDWLLQLDYPLLDHIAFHDPDNPQGATTVVTGDRLRFDTRPIDFRTFLFPLDIPPRESRTYYLRVETQGTMQIRPSVHRVEPFLDRALTQELFYGVFYGIALLMILYNAMLYTAVRDRAYLAYIVTVFSGTLLIMGLKGHAFQYLLPAQPAWSNLLQPLSVAMSVIGSTLFARSFLELRAWAPGLDRLMQWLLAASVITGAMAFVAPYQASMVAVISIGFLALICVGVVSVVCIHSRRRSAIFFSAGWAAFIAGGVLLGLSRWGWLPDTFLTHNAVTFGLLAEIIILSYALSDKYRILAAELADQTRHLSRRVAQRTGELERANRALQEAKREADEASEAKSRFLASMSHEIRTPMNAVLGMISLLGRTGLHARQRSLLSQAKASAQLLLRVINDILDLSRIEADKMPIERRDFQLETVIADLAAVVGERAREQGLELVLDVDSDVPQWLRGDPVRLQQVLVNLATNAIKFTRQGEVAVRVRHAGTVADGRRKLLFSVEDTGAGIAADKIEHLFDPFTQVDDSDSRRDAGAGLGLAICKRLVEAMDGRIEVRSLVGEGSVFSFHVLLDPVIHPPKIQAPQPAAAGKVVPGGCRALLVEDNAVNREVGRELLRAAGLVVSEAVDGEDALEKLSRPQRYDIVFMDVELPKLSGLEVTHRLKADPRSRNLPVVALTAHAMVGDRQRFLDAGMDDYLAKPIDEQALIAVLLRWLGTAEPAESSDGNGASPTAALDAQSALSSLDGDRQLLKRVVNQFVRRLEREAGVVDDRLDEKDSDAARATLQGLRESAGMLGAAALVEALAELEHAIGQAQGEQNALAALKAAIADFSEQAPMEAEDTGAVSEDPEVESHAAVKRLQSLLRNQDMEAATGFDRFRPGLRQLMDDTAVSQLGHLIANLRFDAAADLLAESYRDESAQAGPATEPDSSRDSSR